MTPTEKGRRSDALHIGTDSRRELCNMIANREAEIEELKAEIERLRKKVDAK